MRNFSETKSFSQPEQSHLDGQDGHIPSESDPNFRESNSTERIQGRDELGQGDPGCNLFTRRERVSFRSMNVPINPQIPTNNFPQMRDRLERREMRCDRFGEEFLNPEITAATGVFTSHKLYCPKFLVLVRSIHLFRISSLYLFN